MTKGTHTVHAPDAAPDRARARWRQMVLPTEHGGWSLTAEPVVLGLLVAWSWPGLALGVAAMLAFLVRTPLKLVLVDRWRGRWLDRTRAAAWVATGELALIAVLGAAVLAGSADPWFWAPLAVAAPLVALELWFDMRSRGRRLVPELAGTVGIASVVAAIALVGGTERSLAVGLWCVVAARGAAAVPYVRTQVLRLHGRRVPRWHSDLAQLLATAAVGTAWLLGAIPLAPLIAVAVVAAVNLVLVRRPPRPPVVIGVQQMALGLTVVGVTAVAVLGG